ncbi:MAG: helix-turn-helix domain-containing protein [Tannerella sp.]|jgi:transcriptional regulator with XRE-family HTH domain|nr:helix-turn-helix domain-containing protein [Tannerella sp.]
MKIEQKFGLIIRQLRLEKGLSQEKLALDAEIDRTYIGDIEKGNRNVSISMIEKLANYFQIPISQLFKQIEEYGQ